MERDSRFLDILSLETRHAASLLEVLHMENQALRNADLDLLQKTSQEKQAAMGRIQSSLKQHEGFLRESGMPSGVDGSLAYLDLLTRDASEHAQWKKLQDLADKCRTQNEVNGRILTSSKRQVQQALNILLGGRDADQTYGPRGETSNGGGSHTLVKA